MAISLEWRCTFPSDTKVSTNHFCMLVQEPSSSEQSSLPMTALFFVVEGANLENLVDEAKTNFNFSD